MATHECIVHSRKNVSNFHAAVNQLRRENKFSNDVYQELPKRCCSCKGKQGLETIDLEILREMCEDIMLSLSSTLKFRFSSHMNKLSLMKTEENSSDEEEANNQYLINKTGDGISQDSISTSDSENIDDQHTSSEQENSEDEFLKVLETFKVTTATDGCIVHNSKYQSKFNYAVNLIRRTKKFQKYIYHELSKRCCSCNEKLGLNVIDLNAMVSICHEIESNRSMKLILEKPFHVITLSFESATNSRERHVRICRFIGKKGQNLSALQDKYDVRIHIIDRSSNQKLLKKIIKVQDNTEKREIINGDELYLLIMRKKKLVTDAISIDDIKQEITDKWNDASQIRFIQRELTFDHNESNKQYQFLSLSFKVELSLEGRREIIGRFIGKNGENLRTLEDQYNICLHIINGSSKEKYLRTVIEIQDENNLENFYLFITKKNKSMTDVIPIDEIKERIINQWKEATIEATNLDQSFHFLPLSFDSEVSLRKRCRKIGRFIGKEGQHLRALQDKYNIHVQIVDHSSRKTIRKKLEKVQDEDKLNKLCLFLTSKNKSTTDTIPINEIKQEINRQWKNEVTQSSTELNSDDGWHIKKNRRRK